MPRDIPIIFSAAMVQALLAGRKTMTRRLAWGKPFSVFDDEDGRQAKRFRDKGCKVSGPDDLGTRIAWPPSPWQKVKAGDRLWVRENIKGQPDAAGFDGIQYLADGTWAAVPGATPNEAQERFMNTFYYRGERGAPVPSIHMPRWASRLTLTVAYAKIEGLQVISDADAIAEGVERSDSNTAAVTDHLVNGSIHADRFARLWTSLHGRDSWDANPEVVALSATVIAVNIDAPEARAA